MGRHVDAAGPLIGVRRTAQLCGLVGGAAWVIRYVVDPGGGAAATLLWGGALLLTVALVSLGAELVKSDVLPLRLFVAVALPTLVWGVFLLLRDAVSDVELLDATFGGAVALLSAVGLVRRTPARRATL
jgi:hypothetical protein